MDTEAEKFWSLALEMMEEIPKVREKHVLQLKKIAEMDVKMEKTRMKAEELASTLVERNKEIDATRAKVEEFSQQLVEKNKHIDEIGRKAQGLTELLWEKNKELEEIRKKAEADTMQLEEAHRLETDNVRFQAQQSEAEYHRATFERLRRTLQEKEARQSQLEKELLETRLMAGGKNTANGHSANGHSKDSSVSNGHSKDSSVSLEMQKLQLQGNPAPDAEGVAPSQELKNKSDDDRDHGRNLSNEFSDSSLPNRVESYESMKTRESQAEGGELSIQNGTRDSRQGLKQANHKLLPPVVPMRRKHRFIT